MLSAVCPVSWAIVIVFGSAYIFDAMGGIVYVGCISVVIPDDDGAAGLKVVTAVNSR